ncbi:MAG: tetratricopeptide repeat protein [Candidatus Marinimicrobia bacterium]|nr:tetratricopeptide repeat protein [Candidatus Neomarinimicrobiota bacterium]
MNTLTLIILVLLAALIGGAFIWLRPRSQPQTQAIYTEALSAIIRGQAKQAIDLLRTVVRNDSSHVEAYMHLGDLLREQNLAQKALKIHQSLTVRPDLPSKFQIEIYKSLVLDYQSLTDYQRAAREAEQILRIDRKNLWANEFLLKVALLNEDWDRAQQLAKTTQKIKGRIDVNELAEIKLKEGHYQFAQGNQREAIACYSKANKIAPKYGAPLFELGELYFKQGDLENAIKFWERYALCCPDQSAKVYSKVETTLFELGRFSEAEHFYRRILSKDASILDAMVRLANVLVEKGEQRAAMNLVEETLNKSAGSIPANLMKLKLSLAKKNSHQLSRQIDKILELISSDSDR